MKSKPYSSLRRAVALFLFALTVGTALILKLYNLAMYDNTSKQVLSGQYTRAAEVTEHTGFLYDRHGEPLSHVPDGAVALINPAGSRDKNAVAMFLSSYSTVPLSEILSKLTTPEPFTLTLQEIPAERAPDGVYVYLRYRESDNGFCRHLLGYRDGDGRGRDGIYKRYDELLESFSGSLSYRYLADASGTMLFADAFSVQNKGYTERDGIVLTIDAELQKNLDELCDERLDMGAAVLCDLNDFSIAALCSRPLYDAKNVAASLDSPRGELLNRAFSLYTPGSVFKSVVAAAALEQDGELYHFEYECTGSANVSGKVFHCHNHDGHGVQTMKSAYANSCNTYFIALAEQIGLAPICDMAEKMGLGSPHILDGMYVKAARIPDASVKYTPAYLANISFGQGDLAVSPLDMLKVTAICATGRTRDFSLVRGVYREETMQYFSEKISSPVLSETTVERMREMMRYCVTNGTGMLAYTSAVKTAGKTATAQSGQYDENGEEILHRWFAGVFPADKPRYALVILCDGNGENSVNPAKLFADFAASCAF